MINRCLFTTLMIFVSLQIMAQDFAPIGAKWHYTERNYSAGDIRYLTFESVQDTLFQGKNCKLLSKTGFISCSNRPVESEIVYSEDSAVYFWDKDFDQFQKLYDFKVETGSQWSILIKDDIYSNTDTIKVIVDSITKTEILNKSYKVLNVSYYSYYDNDIEHPIHYSSKIVYPIGDFTYLFNFYPSWSLACDFNYSDGLRCYEDPELGYYSTGIAESCTYVLTSVESIKDNRLNVEVLPNPTQGIIKISCHDNTNYKISLVDNLGRIIKTGDFRNETNLDISTYPKGMYFILIQNETGTAYNTKILKN